MSGKRSMVDFNNPEPHNIVNPTWEYEGIKGDTIKPDCVGKYSGVCIIVSGASNVYEDYEEAKQLLAKQNKKYTLLAVNDIGCFIKGNVHAIITAHPEFAIGWITWRCSPSHWLYGSDCQNKPLIYSSEAGKAVDVHWSGIGNQVGSSGMVACLIAICMGFSKILLCGLPLDYSLPHFFSPYLCTITEEEKIINKKSWEYAINKLPTFSNKVRSLSGLTKKWLKEPTEEWLKKDI